MDSFEVNFAKIHGELFNPHYEKAVLCSVMQEKDRAGELTEKLCVDDFTLPDLKEIFLAICELTARNEPLDPISVTEVLRVRKVPFDTVFSVHEYGVGRGVYDIYFDGYIKKIKELSRLRRYLAGFKSGYDTVYNPEITDAEKIERCESTLLALSAEDWRSAAFERCQDIVGDEVRTILSPNNKGLSVGYYDIDGVTGGLDAGDLIILCGYPSHGKSALALNFLEHVASQGLPCALFSAEMTTSQVMRRLLSQVGEVKGGAMRGKIEDNDARLITEAAEKVHRLPIYICDKAGITVSEIVSKSKSLKRKEPSLAFIVVDYLQRIQGIRSESRNLEVGSISGALKNLAKELSLPILVVASLTKPQKDKNGNLRPPSLWDLRDSGEPGYDCDVGFSIRRNEIFGGKKDECTLAFDKNRKGECDEVTLTWRPEFTRFENHSWRPDRH